MTVWDTLLRRASTAQADHALAAIAQMQPAPAAPKPGSRGWRRPGGGAAAVIVPEPEFRATSVQVCGLYPFGVGSGTPMKGAPLGRHQTTRATVCCDPIAWFQQAKLISNPSAFILGLPGLGKSTIIRRWIIALAATGVIPLVLGDIKPDHVAAIEILGGQVITVGPGEEFLNILDPGQPRDAIMQLEHAATTQDDRATDAASRHDAAAATAEAARLRKLAGEIRQDAHARRLTMVSTLIEIARGRPMDGDREENIISAALRLLERRTPDRAPVLPDLLAIIREAPAELRAIALDRGDDNRYRELTDGLEASLVGLCSPDGALGRMFAHPTTTPMRRDVPVVYDISALGDADSGVLAATQLACWANGFASIHVSQVLAEAGLEPQRHYFVVLDELWKSLEAGSGIVDRINAVTRLNRQLGVGTVMATHSMEDLQALPTEEDRNKARGFIKRAGLVILGGLPADDLPLLNGVIRLSDAEQDAVASWTTPEGWDNNDAPPGRGHFLIKVGGRPGVPIITKLTALERDINDTNLLWKHRSRYTAETSA